MSGLRFSRHASRQVGTHSERTSREHGIEYYQAAVKKKLEGIIAKRKGSTYQPGTRSPDWLKIKQVKTCECVVFGYTEGAGNREETFGALLLGLYDEGNPVYVGRVGTGFSDQDLSRIIKQLEAIDITLHGSMKKIYPRAAAGFNPSSLHKSDTKK